MLFLNVLYIFYSFNRKAGIPYKNPYDRGVDENFAEVFGPYSCLFAFLPSWRDPPVIEWKHEQQQSSIWPAVEEGGLNGNVGCVGATTNMNNECYNEIDSTSTSSSTSDSTNGNSGVGTSAATVHLYSTGSVAAGALSPSRMGFIRERDSKDC